MLTTTLRRVGGSVMMTVSPAYLEQLRLSAGSTVGIETDGESLLIRPSRPRYTVEELLAGYDADTLPTEEEREWLNAPAVGNEMS